MRTKVTDMFKNRVPVFAFSHTREVVAAVSLAGGVGVYGASTFSPERVEADLDWIAQRVGDAPFGVDVMLPLKSDGKDIQDIVSLEATLNERIPDVHRSFVAELVARFDVPPVSAAPEAPRDDRPGGAGWRTSWSEFPLGAVETGGLLQAEIALDRRVSLIVSALGPAPADLADRARDKGIALGALVGSARHAELQLAEGVDLLVAQGTEAAAHTGEISTMVLVPEIVERAGATPVLAAGGITSGRALAASLALGAAGVWTGSVWLASVESDEPPEVIDRLLSAGSADTLRSRCRTGKPLRQLKSPWSAAWDEPGSPGTLPMPTQHLLTADAEERFNRHHRQELMTIPVGQGIGLVREQRTVADIIDRMVREFEAATEALRDSI